MKKSIVAVVFLLTIGLLSGCKGITDKISNEKNNDTKVNAENVVNITNKENEKEDIKEINDDDWISYVNDYITIKYPKEWVLNATSEEDHKGISFLEHKDGEPILSITTGEAWHSNLAKTKEEYEKELKEIYEDAKVEELIKVSIHLQEGTKLVYTYDRDGVETEVIRFDVVVGAVSHQFFFVYPSEDRERLVPTIGHMIESVEFIRNK